MSVDVLTQIVIARPVGLVAGYAADPSNAAHWYVNIRSVRWETTPALAVGSRVTFEAQFLGRQLRYTYEIIEFEPLARLVMRTAQGPFPMQTTYTWAGLDDASTLMCLRNRGEPAGFSKLTAPAMAKAMRRANTKDLARLKALLETHEPQQ